MHANTGALLARPDEHKRFIGRLQHYKLRTTAYFCESKSCIRVPETQLFVFVKQFNSTQNPRKPLQKTEEF